MIDPLLETHQETLFDLLKPYQSKAHKHYLLLDGVHHPKTYDLLIEKNHTFVSLFANKPSIQTEILRFSPLLVDVSDQNHSSWMSIVERCSGLPMLSMLVTKEPLLALQSRLTKYTTANNGDDFYNVRYPDTRRLLGFLKILTLSQQTEFKGPTILWLYVDRKGHWQKLPLNPIPASLKAPKDYFVMTNKKLELWLEDAELDGILYEISQQTPELLAPYKPSEAYELGEKGVKIVKTLQLTSFIDKKEACALLLQYPKAYQTILNLLDTHDFEQIKKHIVDVMP